MIDRIFLGIDVGLASVRAGLFDASGRRLGFAAQPVEQFHPKLLFVEQSSADIQEQSRAAARRPGCARRDRRADPGTGRGRAIEALSRHLAGARLRYAPHHREHERRRPSNRAHRDVRGEMKNPYWLSENADATAYGIHLAEKEEAVTLGAELFGAVACGAFSTLPGAAATVRTKPGNRAFHDAKHAVYLRLYEDMKRGCSAMLEWRGTALSLFHFAMKRKREDEPRTAQQVSFLLRNEFIYRG